MNSFLRFNIDRSVNLEYININRSVNVREATTVDVLPLQWGYGSISEVAVIEQTACKSDKQIDVRCSD